ncbi:MAG: hypothetical protein ACRC1T_11990 [Clostridium chrysemydis]|uniref:hypothetical protein n=1 Tax=Clostridium chrysemydis TaxID=2665504 RepID=UPI003F322895
MENKKFEPVKDYAKNLADNYWKDLSDYSNEKLNKISELIKCNAELGRYEVVVEVLISYQESIIAKLEEVGYLIEIISKDDKYNFIKIKFS